MECLYLQPILRPETHRQTKLRPVWGRRLHSVDGTRHSRDTMSKLKTDQDCNFWLRWPAPGDQFGGQSINVDQFYPPEGESMRVKQKRRRRLFSRSVFSPGSGDTSTSTSTSSRMTKSATAATSTSHAEHQHQEEDKEVQGGGGVQEVPASPPGPGAGGGGVQEALSSLSQCLVPASPSTSVYQLPPGGASCYS